MKLVKYVLLILLFTSPSYSEYHRYSEVNEILNKLIAPQYIRRPGQVLHCNPGAFWDCSDDIKNEWDFLRLQYNESFAFWKLEMFLRTINDSRITLHKFKKQGNHYIIWASGTSSIMGGVIRKIYLTEKFSITLLNESS